MPDPIILASTTNNCHHRLAATHPHIDHTAPSQGQGWRGQGKAETVGMRKAVPSPSS